MKIPIFVSYPTSLNAAQSASRELIINELKRLGLEPRALGRSDYPTQCPVREVLVIARHCAGGVVLGFSQFVAAGGTAKKGTEEEKRLQDDILFPTPWNNLEAGILFALQVPLLVFREDGISGGVFDPGVSEVFVHRMPQAPLAGKDKKALGEVFLKWQSSVRERYYAV